ncbi:8778_t:CDS:1, partial [Acaulospora morrowiae]
IDIPDLIVDLMHKCWDTEPQNRISAEELCSTLLQWHFNNFKVFPKSNITKKVMKDKNISTLLARRACEKNPFAIYTSRLLNFNDLPEPKDSIKTYDSSIIESGGIIKWISYYNLSNRKYLAKGGFGTIEKAVLVDESGINVNVALKILYKSRNITEEFWNE